MRLISFTLCVLLWMTPIIAETPVKASTEVVQKSPEQIQREAESTKRLQVLRDLVGQRRYEEALAQDGTHYGSIGFFIQKFLKETNPVGKTAEKIQRYQDFFRYYPFNAELTISNNFHEWNPLAFEFVALVKQSKNQQFAFEIEAARIYKEILRVRQTEEKDSVRLSRSRQLATQILDKYPASIFTPMAIHEAVWEASNLDDEEAFLRVFESYLYRLDSPKVPRRSYLLLLARYAGWCTVYRDQPVRVYKALAAYQKLADLSPVELEKRAALLTAAKTAMWLWHQDPKSRDLSRTLFTRLIRTAPDSQEASEARQGLLDICFSERQPQQALLLVRQFEKEAKAGSDFSVFYQKVAHGLEDKAQMSLLKEILQRFPQGEAAYLVWLDMANLHRRQGETVQEAAIYQRIAEENEPTTGRARVHFHEAKRRAVSYMAREAEKRQDWEQALKWHRQWRSGDSCGNGAAMAYSANALTIYRCLMNLNRPNEAAEELEKGVLPVALECDAKAMVTLVEHYREHGTLPAFEERLKFALRQPFRPAGALMAQEYLALRQAAQKGDAARLWTTILRKSHDGLDYLTWRQKYGGKLLAEMGETAKAFLVKQARAKQPSPDEPIWACLLLAKMQAPETLAIIQEKWHDRAYQGQKQYLLLALAIHGGQDAQAMLQGFAKGKNDREAEHILRAYPTRESVEFLEGDSLIRHGEPYNTIPLLRARHAAGS